MTDAAGWLAADLFDDDPPVAVGLDTEQVISYLVVIRPVVVNLENFYDFWLLSDFNGNANFVVVADTIRSTKKTPLSLL